MLEPKTNSETNPSLEEFFHRLVETPSLHARFLNTVALLEYIGARKIMKSQRADHFDIDLLTHVTEETRHAWLVKRLALKLDAEAARTWAPQHTLCGKEAERYIQTLDRAAEDELACCGDLASLQQDATGAHINYLYTSLLIEERADIFYGAYAKVLEGIGLAGTLKAIIKDESKHLQAMAERIESLDPLAPTRLAALRKVEVLAWAQFENALWTTVNAL